MSFIVYRCPRCPKTAATVALRDTPSIPLCAGGGTHGQLTEMVRVPDGERVLLDLQPLRQAALDAGVERAGLSPLRVEHLKANGILIPETQHALEWLYRHRATNGMAGAFCKVGGRRCIDLVAFAKLMREQRA